MNRYFPREMRDAPRLPDDARAGRRHDRRVLLVNPFYRKDPSGSFLKHSLTPALGLPALAASTPPDWSVAIHDENLLSGPPPLDPFPAVVGITVHLTFSERACELARWFRRLGAIVVLGGLHVTACPEEAAAEADAICIGDGVPVWPRILADAAAGRLLPVYRGSWKEPFDSQPGARRDLLPRGRFVTTASVIATRGCHHRCGFCYLSTKGLRTPHQVRDPGSVAAEIRREGQPYAVFTDNNLGSRPDYLRDLCRALRPLGIVWSAAVSLDVGEHPDLVREMADSGCTGVFVGFETVRDANLREAGKNGHRVAGFDRAVRCFHDERIQVNGSFVLGFDGDDEDVFDETVDWVESRRLECATFQILTPYPGTPLFARLEREGRILTRDWSLYDTSHAVFQPRRMPPAALVAGYRRCYRRLFTLRSIWRRRPRAGSDVASYLAMSLLYKRLNPVWTRVVRHGGTAAVWRPLVELARWRHRARRAPERCTPRVPEGRTVCLRPAS